MDIKKHLKWIIPVVVLGTGIGAGIVVVCVLSKNTEPIKYSAEWIRKLSDQAWEIEREKVRLRYCSPSSKEEGVQMHSILRLFDSIRREKLPEYNGSIYPYQREHGWNLYKPD